MHQEIVYIGEGRKEVYVVFEVYAGYAGDQYCPPEDSSIEIIDVITKDKEFVITEYLDERVFEDIEKQLIKIEEQRCNEDDYEYHARKEDEDVPY